MTLIDKIVHCMFLLLFGPVLKLVYYAPKLKKVILFCIISILVLWAHMWTASLSKSCFNISINQYFPGFINNDTSPAYDKGCGEESLVIIWDPPTGSWQPFNARETGNSLVPYQELTALTWWTLGHPKGCWTSGSVNTVTWSSSPTHGQDQQALFNNRPSLDNYFMKTALLRITKTCNPWK